MDRTEGGVEIVRRSS